MHHVRMTHAVKRWGEPRADSKALQKHNEKRVNMDREAIRNLVESRRFQIFIGVVIGINAITIGLETADLPMGTLQALFAFDLLCLGIYIVEAFLKLRAYGIDYFKDGWNLFDFTIIVLSLVVIVLSMLEIAMPFPVQVARTVRLFRVVRVFKVVSLFDRLRIIVEAIGRSIPGVLWTCLLLFVVMYVFDVAGVLIYGDEFPQFFGDLAAGLLTLFQILTLEGWPEIARPIIEIYPFAWLFFVPFIVLTAFIMLNIILGIIIETIDESRQAARVEPGATDVQLAAELADLKEQIEIVQRLIDKTNQEKRDAERRG